MDFKIKFRPLRLDDAKFISELRQLTDIERMTGGPIRPVAYERDLKWVEDLILKDQQQIVYFAITLIDSEDIIGYTCVTDIDFRNGKCSFGGIKLGHQYSGQGLGKQSAVKIVMYAFDELRMERCYAECLENNAPALNMMLYAGFKKEGLMRKTIYKNGKSNNQWLLSIVREEYEEIKIKFAL